MRKQLIKRIILLGLIIISLVSCKPDIYYININSSNEQKTERLFLKSILDTEKLNQQNIQIFQPDNAEKKPIINIDILTFWEYENIDIDILISRKILIPFDDFLSERTNTTLQLCLNSSEKLIQIDELKPPNIALRVDGFAAGDEGYPLIQLTGINIHANETIKKENKKLLLEKIDIITNTVNNSPKPLIQSLLELTWLTAGGDMMLERGATEILLDEGPSGIFGETAQMLALSDIALVNLEGVISSRGQRVTKSFTFRFIPEVAAALKNAGISAVLHANNHVFDYGETAFLDSLEYLNKAGIGILGASIDDDSASDPFIFIKGGDEFRIFGIASFPRERNGWDGVTAAAGPQNAGMLHAQKGGIEKLKQKFSPNAVNIVFFHGGIEWSTEPDAATREMYTDLIASGADLVIGTHPHEVQGFEWVNEKPVFWSLGNYVFGGMNGFFTGDEGLFIRLGYYQGKLLYIEPFPIFLNGVRTDITSPEKLKIFYERSRKFINVSY